MATTKPSATSTTATTAAADDDSKQPAAAAATAAAPAAELRLGDTFPLPDDFVPRVAAADDSEPASAAATAMPAAAAPSLPPVLAAYLAAAKANPNTDKSVSYKDAPKVTVVEDGVFRLQIASDLHLEMFRDPNIIYRIIKPAAPYLALLGDIGCPGISGNAVGNGLEVMTKFLEHLLTQFEKVFLLAGNHEFYIHSQPITVTPKTVAQVEQVMRDIAAKHPGKLYYLDRLNPAVVVDGVRVAGVTLWSAVPSDAQHEVGSRMNDYNLIYTERSPADAKQFPRKAGDGLLPPNIRRLHVTDTDRWHAADVAAIDRELRAATAAQQPCVVLTHHAPVMRGTSDPQFEPTPQHVPAQHITVSMPAPATLQVAADRADGGDAKSAATAKSGGGSAGSAAVASAGIASAPATVSTEPNVIAHAFASALDYFFDATTNPQYRALRAWGFGHTHWCVHRTINGIPLVANQRGYEPKEVDTHYRPDFFLSVARDYAAGLPTASATVTSANPSKTAATSSGTATAMGKAGGADAPPQK